MCRKKYYLSPKACQGNFKTSETQESETYSSSKDRSRKTSDRTSLVFDNHGNDSRYTGPVKVSQTLTARLGTGGNNQPFVIDGEDWPKIFDVRISSENTKTSAIMSETTTSRTIDTAGNQPSSNQGGVAIVGVHKPTQPVRMPIT